MYKILFHTKASGSIKLYTDLYRNYYKELFIDTEIWSVEQIVDGYNQESRKRYQEIADIIEQTLSNPIISYSKNETLIKWKSKILLVSFQEKGDTRIITDISIR